MRRLLVAFIVSSVVGCTRMAAEETDDSAGAANASCQANYTRWNELTDSCRAWVDAIGPRTAIFDAPADIASLSVLSPGTRASEAVLFSVAHASGLAPSARGALAPVHGTDARGEFRLLRRDGSFGLRQKALDLFHPGVPDDQTGVDSDKLLPRHDFWFLVGKDVDAAKLGVDTRAYRAVKAGERVLMLGFPAELLEPVITTCTVLDDEEAERAIALLRAEGDEEGNIRYDRDAEGVCEGRARGGMSGGGVFGKDGKLVGAIVRGSMWASDTNEDEELLDEPDTFDESEHAPRSGRGLRALRPRNTCTRPAPRRARDPGWPRHTRPCSGIPSHAVTSRLRWRPQSAIDSAMPSESAQDVFLLVGSSPWVRPRDSTTRLESRHERPMAFGPTSTRKSGCITRSPTYPSRVFAGTTTSSTGTPKASAGGNRR